MQNEEGQTNKYNRTQKTGFVLLFVFTILVVALGFLQMRNNIYSPFIVRPEKQDSPISMSDEVVRLQSIDTDHDGLNDYDELYFYETSPYLPDTDSDGITDKRELDEGTDPNCPQNKVCEEYDADLITTTTPELSPIVGLGDSEPLNGDVSMEELQTILQNPEKLRELLLKTGKINKEELESIDDATLMNLVQNLLLAEPNLTQ